MKKIFFIIAMLLSLNIFSQYKKGYVLKNEIQNTRYNDILQNTRSINENSEIIIETDTAKFRIVIDDQTIENSTGYFRFFNLKNGRHTLSIYHNDILIYNTSVYTSANYRLLLKLSYHKGLYITDIEPITPQNTREKSYHYNNIITEKQFDDFFKYYKSQSFDDGKMRAFNAKKRYYIFSANQIAKLLKEISFDNNQVKFAKDAYLYCLDPENYNEVIDALKFLTSASKVQDYIDELYK